MNMPPLPTSQDTTKHRLHRQRLTTLEAMETQEIESVWALPHSYTPQPDKRIIAPKLLLKQRQGSESSPSLIPRLHHNVDDFDTERVIPPRFLPRHRQKREILFPANYSDESDDIDQAITLPMMVLVEIAKRENQPEPNMVSEISGTASAAGVLGIGTIFGNALKYFAMFFIQYSFGAGIYGIFTLSSSIVSLLSSLFNLGLDDAMVRYIAIYRARQDVSLLRSLAFFCSVLSGAAGVIGMLLLLFFPPFALKLNTLQSGQHVHGESIFTQIVPLLQILSPIVPLMCVQSIWIGGLRGFKTVKGFVLSTNIMQPLLQILLVLVVALFIHTIVGVALVSLITTTCTTAVVLYYFLQEVSRLGPALQKRYEIREWVSFASLNFLTTIIETVLESVDTLLLAFFNIPAAQIGQYGAAIKLSTLIWLPSSALNNIFAPLIAELHSQGEMRRLEIMVKIVTKWTITFSFPIFLIVSIFSPYILSLSGADFESGWPLVVAFAAGILIDLVGGAMGNLLMMTGHQKLSLFNSIITVILTIGVGFFLTPRYGAMGTAISTGFAFCILTLLKFLEVRILLKMQPYSWSSLKPIGAGLLSTCLTYGMLSLLMRSRINLFFILGHSVLSLQLLLIPVFLIMYVGLVVLFKGGEEDEIVIEALKKKFLRNRRRKQSA